MLQDGGLYPTARPLELVRHVGRLYPAADDPASLLERLGIDPRTRTTIRRMSGGGAGRAPTLAKKAWRGSGARSRPPMAGSR